MATHSRLETCEIVTREMGHYLGRPTSWNYEIAKGTEKNPITDRPGRKRLRTKNGTGYGKKNSVAIEVYEMVVGWYRIDANLRNPGHILFRNEYPHLSNIQIAQALNVSEQQVRCALDFLEKMGLIHRHFHSDEFYVDEDGNRHPLNMKRYIELDLDRFLEVTYDMPGAFNPLGERWGEGTVSINSSSKKAPAETPEGGVVFQQAPVSTEGGCEKLAVNTYKAINVDNTAFKAKAKPNRRGQNFSPEENSKGIGVMDDDLKTAIVQVANGLNELSACVMKQGEMFNAFLEMSNVQDEILVQQSELLNRHAQVLDALLVMGALPIASEVPQRVPRDESLKDLKPKGQTLKFEDEAPKAKKVRKGGRKRPKDDEGKDPVEYVPGTTTFVSWVRSEVPSLADVEFPLVPGTPEFERHGLTVAMKVDEFHRLPVEGMDEGRDRFRGALVRAQHSRAADVFLAPEVPYAITDPDQYKEIALYNEHGGQALFDFRELDGYWNDQRLFCETPLAYLACLDSYVGGAELSQRLIMDAVATRKNHRRPDRDGNIRFERAAGAAYVVKDLFTDGLKGAVDSALADSYKYDGLDRNTFAFLAEAQ